MEALQFVYAHFWQTICLIGTISVGLAVVAYGIRGLK